MTNFEDIHVGYNLTFDYLSEGHAALQQAAARIRVARGLLYGLNGSQNPGTSLDEAIGMIDNAYDRLRNTIQTTALASVALDNSARLEGWSTEHLSSETEALPANPDKPVPWDEPFETNDAAYLVQTEIIHNQIDTGENPEHISGYMAKGNTAYVYYGAGNTLIKVPRVTEGGDVPPPSTLQTDYIAPLLRGKGVEGLEQIVDYIPNAEGRLGSVRVKRAPGTAMNKLHPDDLNQIPQAHIAKLIEVIEEATLRGIRVDTDPSNIIYDRVKGFTLIDYNLTGHISRLRTAEEAFMELADPYGLLDSWEPDQPFPEFGRRIFAAYRNKYGAAKTTAFKQYLGAWLNAKASRNRQSPYRLPDDI